MTRSDPRASDFSLTAFQAALIDQLDWIDSNGVGLHKGRSRGSARRIAVSQLVRRGYREEEARAAVGEAVDLHRLQSYERD